MSKSSGLPKRRSSPSPTYRTPGRTSSSLRTDCKFRSSAALTEGRIPCQYAAHNGCVSPPKSGTTAGTCSERRPSKYSTKLLVKNGTSPAATKMRWYRAARRPASMPASGPWRPGRRSGMRRAPARACPPSLTTSISSQQDAKVLYTRLRRGVPPTFSDSLSWPILRLFPPARITPVVFIYSFKRPFRLRTGRLVHPSTRLYDAGGAVP